MTINKGFCGERKIVLLILFTASAIKTCNSPGTNRTSRILILKNTFKYRKALRKFYLLKYYFQDWFYLCTFTVTSDTHTQIYTNLQVVFVRQKWGSESLVGDVVYGKECRNAMENKWKCPTTQGPPGELSLEIQSSAEFCLRFRIIQRLFKSYYRE